MYPYERSLVGQLSDKPFALLGVNSDKDLDGIRETSRKKEITWRSFWNGEEGVGGPISTEWRVHRWPTIYLIDAKGVIRYKNPEGKALTQALTTLLAELGHEVDLSNLDEVGREGNDDTKPGTKDAGLGN